jgi:hypothetical protein
MLLVSLNQAYAELRYTNGSANRPAEYFEHLTAIALERYLGCAVVRIGAPRRPPLPTQFPAALSYTIRQLNEALGRRDLEDQDSGDDGVDLIAWRAFNDSRPSQAILLAQCTIAVEWRDKRDGISLETWKRHIDWHSHPLKGFAVPFHHEQGNSWRETATRGGIIFDRLRIAKLAKGAPLKRQLRTDLEGWCRARINSLASLVIEGR